MWRVSSNMEWDELARLANPWANAQEVALARQFVARLDESAAAPSDSDPGVFYWVFSEDDHAQSPRLNQLKTLLNGRTVLGLKAKHGIPSKPEGPALACEASVTKTSSGPMLDVRLAVTGANGDRWEQASRFSIPLLDQDKKALEPPAIADALAEGVLSRLVKAQLSKGHKVKGKDTFTIKIVNVSPLVLNGLALAGTGESATAQPSLLCGLCVPPRRSLSVPATQEVVDRLKLKGGMKLLAADLSGL